MIWDSSPDPTVVGYKIYYGVVSRTYTNIIDAGNATNVTVPGLIEGTTYYFAATAYNILGMESAFSAETVYTVPTGGNQAPTLDAISNRTINEDASQQTVTLTGISSGAAGENQTLTVTAVSGNTGLIPAPTVTYTSPNTTGTLRFTPVANANGSTTLTVTVNDGGASNNTISRSFTVTVNSVNDPPTLNALSDLALNVNAGQQTVNLSGIGTGAANESQTLTVTANSSNTGLIPNPTVTYTSPNATGSIRFSPVANASGSATITVTVNDSGSSNNILTRTFTVTVNAAPTISSIPDQTIATNSSAGPIAFVIGDSTTPASSLTLRATSSATSLIPTNRIVFGGSSSNRTVTLTPLAGQTGTATITLTVSDGSASASTSFVLTVLGSPAPPGAPQIVINGSGIISPSLNPQTLTMGRTYTITAIPAAGNTFDGWTGSYNSDQPQLTFLMSSNLYLQANFKPAVFAAAAGTYNGLFAQDDGVRLAKSGFFKVSTTTRGTYSGYVLLGGRRYPISGALDRQGQSIKNISRRNESPSTLNLWVGGGDSSDHMFGFLTNGNWVATLIGDRAVFDPRSRPAPYAGKYTLLIPGVEGDASLPAGNSFGVLRVDTRGTARFAGMLADGTRFSQSAALSKDGWWPLFAPLYAGRGQVWSWIEFTNRSESDFDGALTWIKSGSAGGHYYPRGFTNEYQTVGSTYVAPIGANILDFASARAEFTGGNLASAFTNSLTLGPKNKVITGDKLFRMRFALGSGTYLGNVSDPANGRSWPFRGVVLQKLNAGYGFLLGNDQSSAVVFSP